MDCLLLMVVMDIVVYIHKNSVKTYKVYKKDMNGDGLMAVVR